MDNENEIIKNPIDLVKLRDGIIRNPRLTPLAKVIFLDLIFYAGTNSDPYPSQQLLAQNHNYSVRQVYNILKELRENNFLRGWKQRGYSKSNLYDINRTKIYKSRLKQVSNQDGNVVPIQTGNAFLPNISKEVNHGSSNTAKDIEKTMDILEQHNKQPLTRWDWLNADELVSEYGVDTFNKAVDISVNHRNVAVIKMGYVKTIIEDISNQLSTQEKKKFVPCGLDGCDGGMLPHTDVDGYTTYRKCKCRIDYETSIENI